MTFKSNDGLITQTKVKSSTILDGGFANNESDGFAHFIEGKIWEVDCFIVRVHSH